MLTLLHGPDVAPTQRAPRAGPQKQISAAIPKSHVSEIPSTVNSATMERVIRYTLDNFRSGGAVSNGCGI
jgi:hypothetical protein